MVRDWTIDMNKVDVSVCQHVVITGISFFNTELISNCLQFGFVPATYGCNVCIRVRLVYRYELSTKAETNHGNLYGVRHFHSVYADARLINTNSCIVNASKNNFVDNVIFHHIHKLFYHFYGHFLLEFFHETICRSRY